MANLLRAVANISDGFMFSEIGEMPNRYQAASQMGFNAVKKEWLCVRARLQELDTWVVFV